MNQHRTYTAEQIMEQAQVFASAWALVGGPFDDGDQLDLLAPAECGRALA